MADYQFCLAVKLPGFKTKGTHHVAATALTGQDPSNPGQPRSSNVEGFADTHDIHQITLRYLDSSDDVINDSTISGSRKASGGIMQLIFHLVNCFMIGYFLYDMVSQLMSFHKITMQQINSHYVCTQINRSISTTYRLYFANFTFFLLWGDWTYCLFNLPLISIR